MTLQDNDLVQSVAAHEPATTLPATPPRRDSIEDADASFTRKRPRLHSGRNSQCAMSVEPRTPHNGAPLSADNQVEMTIRSHPPSSPARAGHDDHGLPDSLPESPSPAPAQSPILIASSDDEAASPPVMVIDDEDDNDQEDAFGPSVHMDPDDHFARFPYVHTASYVTVVRDLAQHVQDIDNDIDPDFFPSLAQWLINLPDPSMDMQGFYVSKAAFWDDFAVLVHKVLCRRVSFGHQDHDHRVGEMFYEFLSAYVRICSFLLFVDVQLLSRPRSDDMYLLPLISQKHLRHLHTILRPDKAPAYHMVSKEYSVDIRKMVLRLQQDFLAAGGAQNLLQLAIDAIHQVPISAQNHIAGFASPVLTTLGSWMFRNALPSCEHDRAEYSRGTLVFLEKYMDDLFNLDRTTEAGVARDLIHHFHALLFELCLWDKDIEAALVDRFLDFTSPDSPTTPSPAEVVPYTEQNEYRQDPDSFAALVANAWKFKLLRKYLIKGRMDLRVLSIGMMDAALVEIFKQYSEYDTKSKHPVMQYLADFLIDGKVVDYIISVDSHPQILQRSGNIIGFLVVTNRWSDDQADAVWNTVATNPDPRVVSATLTMIRAIIHLMKPTDQLYLCIKLHELLISRYTMNILRFFQELSAKVLERATPDDYATRDRKARPWNVCVRIICDTISQNEADKDLLDLHNEATDHLRSLALHVPVDERLTIYRECADHISSHSEKANGSVKVIYTLASPLHTGDGFFFQQNQDVTRKILEEIPWFIDKEKNMEPSAHHALALRYRLELLALMICRAGPAIPTELYQPLWDHTVGLHAISNFARDWAWTQLFQTIKLIPDNEYCRQLIYSYLPNAEPRLYTLGMFEFVANYNFPTTRELVKTEDEEKTVLKIPGADLLWSMILFSPEPSVEDRAARLLANRYVQINEAEAVTLGDMEAAHIALVEKCMQEIRDACKTVRESCSDEAGSITSDAIRKEKEGRCRRIFLFQKLLIERLRQKPEFNRSRRVDSKVDEMDIPYGDAITIRFQCANGDRQAVSMGPDHTLDDLYRRLCYVSGYNKLNLFAKGHRVDVAARSNEKLSDIDFGGQVLVQRAPDAKVTRPFSGPASGSPVFESAVTRYFDELFLLMDSNDTISQLLFDYLSFFPARNNIPDSVMGDAISSEDLFPPGKFFQARYAAMALQAKLCEQIRNSNLDEKSLAKAIHHLDEALLNPRLIGETISNFQELQLAGVLVNALLDFLRERPSPDVSVTYFSDPARLAHRLVSILSMALETNEDATMIQDCYGAIIEASLHSRDVWETFVEHPELPRLHRVLLLEDVRPAVRENVAKKIASVCGGDLPSTCPLTKGEVAIQFWTSISAVLPHSVGYAAQSQQLFGIADHVFRAQDEHKRDENLLRLWLAQWKELLLNYEHQEVVGRENTDHVVFGLTKLLLCCILSLKSFKQPLNAGNVMEKIFKKYIFTKSSPAMDANTVNVPILQSHTRLEMYDLMLALVDDSSTYNDLLRLVGEVELEECETALSIFSVDRSMEIRSSTGYVGLHNPRALCYANSLLTQLYMNLNFRKFMLGLELQESGGSQKLLLETQRLFTNMQHSFRRSADPRNFTACVKNSDLMPIDISVQMDADEFYNSLFDQWERQLIKEENKQEFRSFYGGQTLNQIKSKECEHVSERSEPFFAIQCDVVGKSTLQESLQAFVSGDVMEGDNKYKCESCDRYVDAVKRTCFKEVPDNLIFHLKRFEFDLADFSRRKVHDFFEFPPYIDINAYHVDYLSNPTKTHKEDIFDLVGVLVHTGTCEHGHYYSYIRERPSPAGTAAAATWVEFDDSSVTPFDPADIACRAFGGMTDDTYSRIPKQYSAYMLFYQRRTAIEEDQRKWVTSTNGQTLKAPMPQALKEEVDAKNELVIREYCQFDPNHTKFLRQLHAMSRTIHHGSCSEDHAHEKQSLQIVLAHLGHTAWRHTSSELFMETMLQLRRTVVSCAMCCNIVLEYFASDEGALFNLLVRCPHAKARSHTRSFFIEALRVLRDKEPVLYGLECTENDLESEPSALKDTILMKIARRLYQTAEDTYLSIRGWDDFYLTLNLVVQMGLAETTVFLNFGFLEFCLKLLSMHVHRRIQDDHPELWRIVSKKAGIYNRFVEFFSTLLSRTDMNLPPVPLGLDENRGATLDRESFRFPLTHRERQMMFYWDPEIKAIAVLDKALEMFDPTRADGFCPGDIVKSMLGWADPQAQSNLFRTIFDGLTLDPPFCDAYVRAALSFCEASSSAENVVRLITAVSKAVASANRLEEGRLLSGIAVLDFLIGLLKAENEALFEQKHQQVFYLWIMTRSRLWVPALLLNPVESVRDSTQLLVGELYKSREDWPPDMMLFKWKSLRELLGEMMERITYEKDAGMPRAHLTPLISTAQFLVQQIFDLAQSEDPDMEVYRDDTIDSARIYSWQTDIEPRLHSWPQDDSISAGELYDQSDFGSESDMEEVAEVE